MALKSESRLAEFEWAIACLMTAVSIFLIFTRLTHAGGLWRDEAGAVQVALMPSVHDITQVFQHEAFPLLFPLTVRTYAAFAGTSDTAFRIFGLLVGLGILAALWSTVRTVTKSVPLLSLALLGFNASVIQWADSLRGYGMGIILMLITFGLIWKVVTSPSIWSVSFAAVMAICSVQTLYHNAVMLFAIGIAGAAVAVRNRHWNRALLVLGIGFVAALSLTPYIPTFQGAKEWNMVFTYSDLSVGVFWQRLSEALSSSVHGMRWIWIVLVIASAAAGVIVQLRSASIEKNRQDAALYCLVALLTSIPAYFCFLKILGYPTQPWYYLSLMTLAAISVDGTLSALPSQWWGEGAHMMLAAGIAIWSFVPTWGAMHIRQTNLDMVAAKLEKAADAGDVIVVAPWYFGITFERYYKGPTPWMTLPPIDDHRLHRYDLLKERMAAANPIDPVLDAMAQALRSGHRVWIVGGVSFPQPGQTPPLLAPAPYDPVGWSEGAYATTWSMQAGQLVQKRALSTEIIPLPGDQPINPYEKAQLIMVRGWRAP